MAKKKSKIYIKPSKRGTFTKWAKQHGFSSVQAAARHVLANKEKYPAAIVKKANFARNAAKWKHEVGGEYLQRAERLGKAGGILQGIGAIASFIPGVGTAIGAGLSGLGTALQMGAQAPVNKYEKLQEQEQARQSIGPTTPFKLGGLYTPKIKYAYGGSTANPIIPFEGPRHEEGGIPLGENAEVEGGEAGINTGGLYILTDRYGIGGVPAGKGVKSLAELAKQAARKRKGLEGDAISKRTLAMELGNLIMENQRILAEKQAEEQPQEKQKLRHGGVPDARRSIREFNRAIYAQIPDEPPTNESIIKIPYGQMLRNRINKYAEEHVPDELPTNESVLKVPYDQVVRNQAIRYADNNLPDEPSTGENVISVNNKRERRIDPTLSTGDLVQLGATGLGLIGHAGIAFQRPERVRYTPNPLAQQAVNQMLRQKYNEQHIVNDARYSFNKLRNQATNTLSTPGARLAALSGITAKEADAIDKIRAQGDQIRNQIYMNTGKAIQELGEQDRRAKLQQQELQAMNDAVAKQARINWFNALTQAGVQTGQMFNQDTVNKIMLDSLEQIATEYGLSKEELLKLMRNVLKSGSGGTIYRFKPTGAPVIGPNNQAGQGN